MHRRRVDLGWDRQRLAQAAGTTQATIHRVETGKMHPRDHMKLAIAAALGVEAVDLWPYPAVDEASSRSAVSM